MLMNPCACVRAACACMRALACVRLHACACMRVRAYDESAQLVEFAAELAELRTATGPRKATMGRTRLPWAAQGCHGPRNARVASGWVRGATPRGRLHGASERGRGPWQPCAAHGSLIPVELVLRFGFERPAQDLQTQHNTLQRVTSRPNTARCNGRLQRDATCLEAGATDLKAKPPSSINKTRALRIHAACPPRCSA